MHSNFPSVFPCSCLMEPLSNNSSKRSLREEEDARISTFRRRNKIVIFVLVFLITSLTLTIAALIISLVYLDSSSSDQSHTPPVNPALKAFCFVSDAQACLRTLNPIVSNRSISDPNQIFSLSLQAAAEDLQRTIASLTDHADRLVLKNCSDSLRDGLDQIRDPLKKIRVDPFLEWRSDEQRTEMMNRIMAAEEDVERCLDDLGKNAGSWGGVTAELVKVRAYLNGAGDYVIGYAEVLQMLDTLEINRSLIFENAFGVCVCGLQLLFVFCLYCSLFRVKSA